MKSLKLKASSCNKLLRNERELTAKDVDEVPKGIIPGEWIFLVDEANRKKYLSYINPHSDSYHNIKVIKQFPIEFKDFKSEEELAINVINEKLLNSINKRKIFQNYSEGCRLVYGSADEIPGLIVDMYKKYILIQINTAGLDRFRTQIQKIFKDNFTSKEVILFDNVEYRKFETLPIYDNDKLDADLDVQENEIKYSISSSAIQKIGFYYDHRENRKKLMEKITEMNLSKNTGLDLFSYVGSWGLHLLRAGIQNVDFVDQGDMEKSILKNLELNGLASRGQFFRKDVFKFLDEANGLGKKWDVIVSDPPSFTKSEKNKHTAIQGYEKLHQKALKLVNENGLFVAASCTHYVDIQELDKTVQDAAFRNGQKVNLLDLGIQGHDHPMTGFKDKGFYIKYLLYLVQRG